MNLRMRKLHLSPPRAWLISLVLPAIVAVVLGESVLLPAYDDWQESQNVFEVRSQEYSRLMANLAARRQIGRHFESLAAEAFASETDESAVSDFLRDLETKCRKANLLLSSMRPLAAKKAKSYRCFPVKLAVSGGLADVSRFLADVSAGPAITGVEGFSIRGVHGSDNVECQLSVWMVRLSGAPTTAPATATWPAKPTTQPKPATRSARGD